MAGGKLTNLPSMKLDGMMYYVSAPISFCYGLKTNLYIGDHFYCYAQYSNSTTTNMVSYTSQIVTDYSQTVRHIPVDMGTIRVGAVLVLEPWW